MTSPNLSEERIAELEARNAVEDVGPRGKIKLDDKTVEQKTAHYPDKVREPVMWAAAYTRERCNWQLTVLEKHCKEIGFQYTYSTWHKIFTGNYFAKGAGGKIVGSVDNFLQVVEALRKKDRLDWRAGKMQFIETPTWEGISDFIDRKRQPSRVNKFGAIVGPTGSQKSACFIEYCIRNNHGACKRIEAPERPNLGQFITDLAFSYGVSRHYALRTKIDKIAETVNETKTIIIDNIQRLYIPDREGNQPAFNYILKLQDDTNCTVIMSWTPDFTSTLKSGTSRGYFEQFIGRMGGLGRAHILDDYAPREDVLCIAKAYGLKDAHQHIKYLETIAREAGRIRILFEDLQDAKQLAAADGKDLTIDYIKQARGEE